MASAPNRVLIIDDEPALLRLIESYLSRLGFEVVACSSSQEAWDLFEREPSAYPFVMSDVTMPGMSGTELVARMFDVNPCLRVLLASGYSPDVSAFPASVHGQIGFLKKPFLPEMLVRSVEGMVAK